MAGSTAYSGIALVGVFRFLRFRRKAAAAGGAATFAPPVSILKPLYGTDRELERNLESFCRQEYPSYEILFSVRQETDEAVPAVRRLQERFPQVPMRLLVTGPPRYLNAKVHGLEAMAEAAAHDIFVINDSGVRVAPDYLRSVVLPLADPAVGLVTSIARSLPGKGLWPLLEALGINTQFNGGVLTAWLLLGMHFSIGKTMVIRKPIVQQLGGFGRLGDYLADDFLLGEWVAAAGYAVHLSATIPDNLLADERMADSLRHRLRWERSSRRSRPAGYLGQIFLHSFPLALAAGVFAPHGNPLLAGGIAACLGARALLAWALAGGLLRDPSFRKHWWLLPLQDLVSFSVWVWAFFGREIVWRGARFRVLEGGRLERISGVEGERSPENVKP